MNQRHYRVAFGRIGQRGFRHIVTDVIAREPRLGGLFRVAQHFARWHVLVARHLPEGVRDRVRLVCARGDTVVFYADNGMIANKLRMLENTILQALAPEIELNHVQVHVRDDVPMPRREKTLTLSSHARASLRKAAEAISDPALRASMLRLARVNLDEDENA